MKGRPGRSDSSGRVAMVPASRRVHGAAIRRRRKIKTRAIRRLSYLHTRIYGVSRSRRLWTLPSRIPTFLLRTRGGMVTTTRLLQRLLRSRLEHRKPRVRRPGHQQVIHRLQQWRRSKTLPALLDGDLPLPLRMPVQLETKAIGTSNQSRGERRMVRLATVGDKSEEARAEAPRMKRVREDLQERGCHGRIQGCPVKCGLSDVSILQKVFLCSYESSKLLKQK